MPAWLRSLRPAGAGAATMIVIGLALPAAISAQPSAPGTPGSPPTAQPPSGAPGPAAPVGLGPCVTARRRLRCPDLIMSAPRELHLDRSTIPGRVLLRATSSVNNRGTGPMELRARRTGEYGTVVYQAIYGRHGRVHLFHSNAKLTFKHVSGDRYEYGNVGDASYWKLRHAAAFELWSVDARGRALRLVRRGPKVDYCLRDLFRTRPSRRSPSSAVYPGCSEDFGMRHDVLGTSVGWSDVYPYEYPEQWIDVTGLRGRFAYVQIADPDHLLLEANNDNNVSETYITLPSGRIHGTRVGVVHP